MNRILTLAKLVWLETLRRKDLYVLFILLAALLLMLLSMNVFGLGAISRYVMDTGLLATWLFSWILTISVAARQLPQEESRGTIYPLLAKPLTRGELILGKWLGAWSVACAATVLFYALVSAVTMAKGGGFRWATLGQAGLLHAVQLGIIGALGLALSTRETYGAAVSLTYVVGLACLVIVPRVPELVLAADGFRMDALLLLHYALPHLQLFDLRQRLVHDWGQVPWTVVAQIMAYGLVWVAIFLVAGWLGYRRKYFPRGAASL